MAAMAGKEILHKMKVQDADPLRSPPRMFYYLLSYACVAEEDVNAGS